MGLSLVRVYAQILSDLENKPNYIVFGAVCINFYLYVFRASGFIRSNTFHYWFGMLVITAKATMVLQKCYVTFQTKLSLQYFASQTFLYWSSSDRLNGKTPASRVRFRSKSWNGSCQKKEWHLTITGSLPQISRLNQGKSSKNLDSNNYSPRVHIW